MQKSRIHQHRQQHRQHRNPFFSKLFLLAFVGLSLAIGLREDAMGDDPMAKSDGLGVGTDARSMGDKIHISFCQS